MCAILLSINPQYVTQILRGDKKYEFRKSPCKRKVDKIVIYCTSPVMKIVGEAEVEDVLVDEPEKIWSITQKYSGIERTFFDQYYSGRKQAVAYKLSCVTEYEKPRKLIDYGIKTAPQSFCYLDV